MISSLDRGDPGLSQRRQLTITKQAGDPLSRPPKPFASGGAGPRRAIAARNPLGDRGCRFSPRTSWSSPAARSRPEGRRGAAETEQAGDEQRPRYRSITSTPHVLVDAGDPVDHVGHSQPGCSLMIAGHQRESLLPSWSNWATGFGARVRAAERVAAAWRRRNKQDLEQTLAALTAVLRPDPAQDPQAPAPGEPVEGEDFSLKLADRGPRPWRRPARAPHPAATTGCGNKDVGAGRREQGLLVAGQLVLEHIDDQLSTSRRPRRHRRGEAHDQGHRSPP